MKSQNFAVLVRSKRGSLGLTQVQLAEQSGLSVRTIKKIENDGHIPGSKIIDRLRNILKIEDEDWSSRAVLVLKYNLRNHLNRGDDIRHILQGMLDTPDDFTITIADILKMLEIEQAIGHSISPDLVTVIFKGQKNK